MDAPSSHAVFLSYAREDADGARRIADALRAVGVEVWFDQSELRGGDAWDANIRQQIQDCALFVPVISAHTQARREAYFRLEWKLADERTHLMAEGTPFVLPVVIEDTKERGALVPKSFLGVQWTRLAGGTVPPAFVHRVRQLLGGEAMEAERPRHTQHSEGAAHQVEVGRALRARPWVLAAAAAFVLIAAVGGWRLLFTPPTAVADANPGASPSAAAKPLADFAPAKSIAVLPFDNLSPDRENEFFCDGMHEDVLAALQLVADLKVIGGKSVAQYRGTTKTYQQIGREMGVAYVLEGSVRRADNTVKIVGKLIDARTGQSVWIKPYERGLANVFAIQAELAQAIVGALQATLTPEAKSRLDNRPTESPEVYDLILKARGVVRRYGDLANDKAEALLEAAVKLDPNSADAWANLASIHSISRIMFDHTDARLARARAALDHATRLAPDSLSVVEAKGNYHAWALSDFSRGADFFIRLTELQPGYPQAYNLLGFARRFLGQYPEAVAVWRKGAELDPANTDTQSALANLLLDGRRYADAVIEYRRLVNLHPTDMGYAFGLANLPFQARGSTKEMDMWFDSLSPEQKASPRVIALRKYSAQERGDFVEAMRLDELQPEFEDITVPDRSVLNLNATQQTIAAALVLATQRGQAAAQSRLRTLPATIRAELDRDPTRSQLWTHQSQIELILGRAEDALSSARKAVEFKPESINPWGGALCSLNLASIQAWTGDKAGAIAELTRLLRIPLDLHVHAMRHAPRWKPLQGDPRFEALLNDPKNNAPLF